MNWASSGQLDHCHCTFVIICWLWNTAKLLFWSFWKKECSNVCSKPVSQIQWFIVERGSENTNNTLNLLKVLLVSFLNRILSTYPAFQHWPPGPKLIEVAQLQARNLSVKRCGARDQKSDQLMSLLWYDLNNPQWHGFLPMVTAKFKKVMWNSYTRLGLPWTDLQLRDQVGSLCLANHVGPCNPNQDLQKNTTSLLSLPLKSAECVDFKRWKLQKSPWIHGISWNPRNFKANFT